ncbi:MAG: hypothetical protein ABI132_05275 [Rhodanobacteraceae bacterium]
MSDSSVDEERINDALQGYPWRGGYSYVNIYTVLQNRVPPILRPRVCSISYASPGWIELSLCVDAMVKIAGALTATGVAAITLAKAYKSLHDLFSSIAKRRAQHRIETLQLSVDEVRLIRELGFELAKQLGFTSFEELIVRTGSVETAAKLIAAQYRRIEVLSEFVKNGRAKFPLLENVS